MARSVRVLKNGKWEDKEQASPENLREDLKQLPADYVTKDDGDPDKIYESDAPHIVAALTEEQDKAQQKSTREVPKELIDLVEKLSGEHQDREIPLNQREIDIVRMRVIRSLIDGMVQSGIADLSVKHLWFPKADAREYELRIGNPPADSERPRHMRNFNLAIDVTSLPLTIMAELKMLGIEMPEIPDPDKKTATLLI